MFNDRIAVSIREAATATGYSPELIRKAITVGVLTASRPGGIGDYRILVDDLVVWLKGSGRQQITREPPKRAAHG